LGCSVFDLAASCARFAINSSYSGVPRHGGASAGKKQGGPVEFARSINRVRSLAQKHEMRTSQARARPMTDREVVIQAFEEAQRILAEYIEPGRGGAVATVKVLLDVLNVLDRREVVAALNRLKPGHGLHVVK
jgi:hypothetical protein